MAGGSHGSHDSHGSHGSHNAHGHPSHGKFNIDAAEYTPYANRGLLARFINALPVPARIPVGTVTVLAAGYLTYLLVRPSRKNRPVHTLTPEWEKATEAYLEAQNMNPIRRYKEAGQ